MQAHLTKHDNGWAIVIDKSFLETAGITENTLLQISVRPNGGLVIQSIEDDKTELFQENFEKLNKKYKKLMQNLADS